MTVEWARSDHWQDAWASAIAAIGEDFADGIEIEAADEIERGDIRRYCEPIEFDCPLHHDEAVARAHGYRGLVAPWSGITSTWSDPGHWKPGLDTRYTSADPNHMIERPWQHAGRPWPIPATTAASATDMEIEYFEPACVGDRLRSRGRRLVDVTVKETSIGRGGFLTWERDIVNQRGDLVAKARNGVYYYVPHEESPASAPIAPVETTGSPAPQPAADPRPVDWRTTRYFEDIHEGDQVPPVLFNLTVFRLVVAAGANRDFAQIHHNSVAARRQGAPDVYANNVFVQAMWERAIREYIGLQGGLKKIGPFRMRIFNPAGEAVVTRGVVRRKWIEGDDHLVELEMRCEHSRGVSVGPGPVLVSLPSRT